MANKEFSNNAILINQLYFNLSNYEGNISLIEDQQKFRGELLEIMNIRDMYEGKDIKKYGYFKFHYHKLNSIYFKKINNNDRSCQENTIAMNFISYEDASGLIEEEIEEPVLEESVQFDVEPDELTDELNEIIELIKLPDFKESFDGYLKLNPHNICNYIKCHSLNIFLNKILDESVMQSSEEMIENEIINKFEYLRDYINKLHKVKRKYFMEKIASYDEIQFQKAFFSCNLTSNEIDSSFRKFSIFFHPDKNKNLPYQDQDLCEKIFARLYETKEKLQKKMLKTSSSFDDFYKDAEEHFKFGLEYFYASKKEFSKLRFLQKENISSFDSITLKNISKRTFKKAYENFKSACTIADESVQYARMLECRINMAASLFMGNFLLESQLIASAAVKLTENNLFKSNFNIDQKNKALRVFEIVKLKQIDEIIGFINEYENINNSSNNSLETLKNLAEYIRLNSNIVDLEAQKEEENTKIYSNNFKKIKSIAALVPAGILAVGGVSFGLDIYGATAGMALVTTSLKVATISLSLLTSGFAILPAVFISIGLIKTHRMLKSAKENLKIRQNLDKIMEEMQIAYRNNDFKQFLIILSKKYDEKCSLININFDVPNQIEIPIHTHNMKKILFNYGFRPEAIAYLFLLLFEALMAYPDWNDFYQINISKTMILAKCEELLNAILLDPPENDKENINLEKEAMKLDKKLDQLRRNFLFESWSSNKINRFETFLSTKGIIDDKLIKEGQITSFMSRLNEVRCIAAINKFLKNILNKQNEEITKQSLLCVQKLLNLEYKYVMDSHLRFEVLKDLIWLFTTNNELTDMIVKDTHNDKEVSNDPDNKRNIEFEEAVEKLEIKASTASPIEKIKYLLDIYSMYDKKLKENKDGQDLKISIDLNLGYARCCLSLAKYKLVLNFLNSKRKLLCNDYRFWLFGSIAHRKMNNNFDKANDFMTEAKRINYSNVIVQKEAKKLEKLKEFNAKNYVNLLDPLTQPLVPMDQDFIGTRRSNKTSYKILSIDGGGVRGIIPSIWLREIEIEMRKPISSLFNMITGTSTGAIIATALTIPKNRFKNTSSPYSAADIVKLYINESKSIFLESNLIDSFRSASYKESFRSEMFKKYFGDIHINKSLTDLVIPAICENDRTSTFKFSKVRHKQDDNKNFSYYDILMATTAAPTFFKPHYIPDFGDFMDGGLTCNNPSEIGFHEAMKVYGDESDFIKKISILSLGTGAFIPDSNFHKESFLPKYLFWGKHLKDYVMPPIEGDIDRRMSNLLNNKYHRWQVFTENEIPFDKCDDGSLITLIEIARQYIEDLREDDNNSFNKIIELLEDD